MYLENRCIRLHMFGKSSFLDLEPSTMIHADSVSFLTSTDVRIQKYSSMFSYSWTNPSVNSQWYIKMCALMWLRVYNDDLGLQLVQLYWFVLNIPDTLLTFCFIQVSCDMQIS